MQLTFAIDMLIKLNVVSMIFTGISISEYVSANIDAIAKACMYTMRIQYILDISRYADCLVVITSVKGEILGFYMFVLETMELPIEKLLSWDGTADDNPLAIKGKQDRRKIKVLNLLVLACSNAEGSKGLGSVLLSTVKAIAWSLLDKTLPGPLVVLHAMMPLHCSYYNLHGFVVVTPSFLKENGASETSVRIDGVPMLCLVTDKPEYSCVGQFIKASITGPWPENPFKAMKAELASLSNEASTAFMHDFMWRENMSDIEAEALLRFIQRRDGFSVNELRKMWRMRQICYGFKIAEGSKKFVAPGDFCASAFEDTHEHIVTVSQATALKQAFLSFVSL